MKIPTILYIILAPLYPVCIVLGLLHALVTYMAYPAWFVCLMFLEGKLYTLDEYFQWISQKKGVDSELEKNT